MDADDAPLRVPLETTALDVPQTAYPSEVTCRKCRHLMIPGDAEGRSWECWVCARRIEVRLVPPRAE